MTDPDFTKLDAGTSTSRIELVSDDASIRRPTREDLADMAKAGLRPDSRSMSQKVSVTRNELDALANDGSAMVPDLLGGAHKIQVGKIPIGQTVRITATIDPESEHGTAVIRALYDSNADARAVLDKHGYKR